ncbi:MAG TPA: acetate/propionate family kinase [Candidatus Sulfotelmatobacter sp.]|nr:acetate/propionate family kinase [Candidatus Sulfotelmatobacter sp.]HWI56411.1 acetate/propionate family kinase [Bacillota bacterium]
MTDAILVLNAGSSSIKFSIFTAQTNALALDVCGQIDRLFTAPHFVAKDLQGKVVSERSWPEGAQFGHDEAMEHLRLFLREELTHFHLIGVGHRVGHGGLKFAQPVRVDAQVLAELEALTPLVPLHQPHNLMPIRFLLKRAPDLPQVACFDTAFHRTNPPLAQLFALPKALTAAGVRRYGFHGLSYEYIASVLPDYDARAAAGKTVVLHLGNGSSMCALAGGQSVTSTMGFSSLEGLPMGTRCGTLDPGVILFLLEQRKMSVRDLEHLLYSESGLLGVSGLSSDVRTLLGSESPDAKLALDLYVSRIGRELGSLAAALGGLDALVFTAGVGENAVAIRERVCRHAAWLGVEFDAAANAKGGPRITTAQSRVTGWVIPTNEEWMVASHTLRLLAPH